MIDCYKIWSKALKVYKKKFPQTPNKSPGSPLVPSAPLPVPLNDYGQQSNTKSGDYVRLAPPPPYVMARTDIETPKRRKKLYPSNELTMGALVAIADKKDENWLQQQENDRRSLEKLRELERQ